MKSTNFPENQNEQAGEVNLASLFYKYLPYWPWFVALVLGFVFTAWLIMRYMNPIYETTASILIKSDPMTGTPVDPMNAFSLFGANQSVENEMEILQSKTLMQEVVENLLLYAPVSEKGRIMSSNIYGLGPVKVQARYIDSLKKVPAIPFNYDAGKQLIVTDSGSYPLNTWVKTPYGELKFLPVENSPYFKQGTKAHDFYFSLNTVKGTANNLLSALSVSSSKMSSVITISIKGTVPRQNEDILNELLKVYNQAAILDKNALAAATLKFVDERLKLVTKDLDSVENALQNFRTKNKLTDISTQGQIFLQSVADNDKQINEIETQLAVLGQVNHYLESGQNIGGIVPSTLGITDPSVTGLLSTLSDLEIQYEQKKNLVPAGNPAMISLKESIEKIRPEIRAKIANQVKNLTAARNDLVKAGQKYTTILSSIPRNERELLSISRQQSIKNNVYTFLLQKREETALSLASTLANTRVVDLPESSEFPVSPKKKLIYIFAFLAAILTGFGIISLKGMLTRNVQSRNEIERFTYLPLLGEIAYDVKKRPIAISEGRRGFIAEQFRELRTSLGYMGIGQQHKRILVTSSISNEGKSFVTTNLGISLSLTGKKVVLLELDLRKPKLSEVFEVKRTTGITNYLVGTAGMAEIVRETGIKNVSIIPSGPIPPNPSELISNGRLESLLEQLDKQFDFILMDTTPTQPVTDAFLLSPMADITIYIVRHTYTPKAFLNRLEQLKESGRLKNPAIVYNMVKNRGTAPYGNGYGYIEDWKPWWKQIFKK